MSRARRSLALPALKGTTMRTGRVSAACAPLPMKHIAMNRQTRRGKIVTSCFRAPRDCFVTSFLAMTTEEVARAFSARERKLDRVARSERALDRGGDFDDLARV